MRVIAAGLILGQRGVNFPALNCINSNRDGIPPDRIRLEQLLNGFELNVYDSLMKQ